MIPIDCDLLAERPNGSIPQLAEPAVAHYIEVVDTVIAAEAVEVEPASLLDGVAVEEIWDVNVGHLLTSQREAPVAVSPDGLLLGCF